jgi:hypothetical protein
METHLVATHSCIKNGDRVVIRATVVEGRRGAITTLTAHNSKCKGA